jgi:hypothetical protein
VPRAQDDLDDVADRVVVGAQLLGKGSDQVRRQGGILADEKAVELATEEVGAGRLLQRDADDVADLPVPRLPQERLLAVVEGGAVEAELPPRWESVITVLTC